MAQVAFHLEANLEGRILARQAPVVMEIQLEAPQATQQAVENQDHHSTAATTTATILPANLAVEAEAPTLRPPT